MLKTMRKNVKSLSWVLWLVILTFVGFIFVQWGSGRFESEGLANDVAAVGSYKISGEEFQKNLTQSLEMYSKQFKNNLNRQTINQLGIAEQVLQGMISGPDDPGEAEKLNLEVSDANCRTPSARIPPFSATGRFIGSEEYERLLAYNQMTVMDFEDGLKKGPARRQAEGIGDRRPDSRPGYAARATTARRTTRPNWSTSPSKAMRSRKSPRSAKRRSAGFLPKEPGTCSKARKKGPGRSWP